MIKVGQHYECIKHDKVGDLINNQVGNIIRIRNHEKDNVWKYTWVKEKDYEGILRDSHMSNSYTNFITEEKLLEYYKLINV